MSLHEANHLYAKPNYKPNISTIVEEDESLNVF